jgi:predicted transcriptional regulator
MLMSPSRKPYIPVRLDQDVKEAAERVARRRRQKTSEYVRQVLIDALLREGETLAEPPAPKAKKAKK